MNYRHALKEFREAVPAPSWLELTPVLVVVGKAESGEADDSSALCRVAEFF